MRSRKRIVDTGQEQLICNIQGRDSQRQAFASDLKVRIWIMMRPSVEVIVDRGVNKMARRRAVKSFLIFFAIYLFTWGGHYTSGDGAQKIAWAKAIFLRHSADIDPGPGISYSKYGIGHSLIAIPPLAIANYIQKTFGIRCEAALYTLLFVANGALFLGFVTYYLSRIHTVNRVWPTVVLLGIATTWWPYTKLDFSEPLVTTLLFAGFVVMRFGFPLAGTFIAGFTLPIRIDSVVLIVPLIAWSLWKQPTIRRVLEIAIGLLPPIALTMIGNYVRFHSFLDKGYAGEAFATPMLAGLFGILLSFGKSVFLFSPPLLLGCLGWKRFYKHPETRPDACFFLAAFSAQVLFYSKWWDWSSDDAWGVRFLIPGVMLLCIPMVELLRATPLVLFIAASGIWVQTIAVAVGGLDFVLLLRTHRFERQALYVDGRNRVDFEELRFSPNYNQIIGSWILFRHLLHIPPHRSSADVISQIGTPLYDCIAPEIWANAARWDFIWAGRTKPLPGEPSNAAP